MWFSHHAWKSIHMNKVLKISRNKYLHSLMLFRLFKRYILCTAWLVESQYIACKYYVIFLSDLALISWLWWKLNWILDCLQGFLDEQFIQLEELQDDANPNFVEEVVTLYYRDSSRLILNIDQALYVFLFLVLFIYF